MYLQDLIGYNLLTFSIPLWDTLIAGAFVLIALSSSFYLLFEHLSAYRNPEEQKFLIGVIIMVPCYAVESFVSLLDPSISVDIEILRDCYESFAMYCFGRYLVACLDSVVNLGAFSAAIDRFLLWFVVKPFGPKAPDGHDGVFLNTSCLEKYLLNMAYVFVPVLTNSRVLFLLKCAKIKACGEERTIEFLEREGRLCSKAPLLEHNHERGIIKHPFPMNYIFKPWKPGQWFYQVVKFGIVQYMLIKSLTAVLAVLLEVFGVYCEGDFKLRCGYPYMAVVLNFSQSWALYCLVQFYTATKDELAHIKPLYKFLTFKSIVFLTWWQGVAIALLYSLGLLKSPIAQGLQFKSSIQDFIICIEVNVLGDAVRRGADNGRRCHSSEGGWFSHGIDERYLRQSYSDYSLRHAGELCHLASSQCIHPAQMGIASIVHLYVFPAKPYELIGDRFPGSVAVLGDYVSVDCPVDPDEVRDSERPTKLRLPQPDTDVRSGMTIKESVRDVVVGGGGFVSCFQLAYSKNAIGV
ncbi:hypothetical protein DKX38_014803 [Salix brachista]|uniref:Protein LAZ1 n=1 Tax=Salix brachista TaxID=2182728 RepID=A0A5N5LGC9_9ROSI|nr:hypothetical protein DKX38_014803 [Salix brachista]